MGPSSCLVLNMVDEDEDTFCIVSKFVRISIASLSFEIA